MKRVILLLALLIHANLAFAEAPLQLSVPNGRAPDDPNVNGIRISLFHGRNESVRGLDLGLLSVSETGNLSGLGLVAGMGKVTGDMTGGAAISLINIHNGRDAGLNAAFINRLGSPEKAVNIGFVQIADGETLLDIGGLNVSDRSTVQLGFINVTDEIKGFQFGFVNIARNGFLPFFPIFNFPKGPTSPSTEPQPRPERRAPGQFDQ
jgi:hypothetical protein